MDNRPIGVFDSGMGGLTAVVELQKVLPREKIVYFGDTGRVPYGTKSPEILKKYTQQDIDFLKTKNVKMILAACGTVSSAAGEIGEHCGVLYSGVLKPTAAAAIRETRNGRIGVIGTPATIRSGAYERLLKTFRPEAEIFSKACPLFVPLVENRHTKKEDPLVAETLKEYLSGIREMKIDTLILGCTHYPLLAEAIGDFMGQGVTLINSGREAARFCARVLRERSLLCEEGEGEARYYVSDSVDSFRENARACLGAPVDGPVEWVAIDDF
ncbi:MAG: glutamate racemase [Clostridia bacterium]|nr:glutamate racemase [Clostridia bacterium]